MQEVVLDKIMFALRQRLDRQLIEDIDIELPSYQLKNWVDYTVDAFVVEMRMILLGKTNQEKRVKYPADWWQAVKERFAPRCVLNRWPVRYTEVVITATELYPSISPDIRKAVFQVNMRKIY